jgi:hypothetical protein
MLEARGDAHPDDNSFWVNAKDQLSLSVLQARLIEQNRFLQHTFLP